MPDQPSTPDEPPATPPIYTPLHGSLAAEPAPTAPMYTPLDGSAPPTPTPPTPSFASAQSAEPAVYVYASWLDRAMAYIVDLICINVLPLAITVPLGMAFGLTAQQSADLFTFQIDAVKDLDITPLLFVVLGLQALLQLVALSLFVWLMDGQTPGKKLAKIKVVMADGSKLTLGVALRREMIAKAIVVPILAILTLGVVALANFLWPVWDKEWRAGHDAFAKTRVVVA